MNNIQNKNTNINIKKGFTLLEVVLIMFIVVLTFTGIYSILAKISQHEKDNRYGLIAANLAQEGVEMVRNRRDENIFNGLDINDGLSSGICYPYWDGLEAKCDNGKGREIEIVSDVYRNCNPGGCGANPTIFERSCEIDVPNPPNDPTRTIEVSCKVEWKSPSLESNKEVEMSSILTNWQ